MKTSNKTILNENGATLVYVAVTLTVLVMFAALAIDVGHLYGVRNELQNAADAGALAGARVLFKKSDGSLDRPAAIAEGTRVTEANKTDNQYIDINTNDVQIGHWSFYNRMFKENSTGNLEHWQGLSFKELDENPNFINAVKVEAKRNDTPSFFAKIFGFESFFVIADAVAYVGFPSTLNPKDVDQPIAICEEAISVEGKYVCDKGNFINDNEDTGGWTNLQQPDSCLENSSGANAQEVKPLVCSGNVTTIQGQKGIQMINGEVQSAFDILYDCWVTTTGKTKPMAMVLPVIKCGGSAISGCKEVVGAVTLDVIWINNHDNAQNYNDAPRNMTPAATDSNHNAFICPPETTGEVCWNNFVTRFGLGTATYEKQTIYFLTSCEKNQIPIGTSGGLPFDLRAEIPVLVE